MVLQCVCISSLNNKINIKYNCNLRLIPVMIHVSSFLWLPEQPILVNWALSHHFPLSLPLEEPLDGGLRGARLTLQEGAAALHPKLHRLPQAFLHCTNRKTMKTAHKSVKACGAELKPPSYLWH